MQAGGVAGGIVRPDIGNLEEEEKIVGGWEFLVGPFSFCVLESHVRLDGHTTGYQARPPTSSTTSFPHSLFPLSLFFFSNSSFHYDGLG